MNPPLPDESADLSADHPAYGAHQSAIRSIQRVVDEIASSQDVRVAADGIAQLLRLKPLVITGAGISTDSGIPDYRGPQGSLKRHRPMTYQEFKFDPFARHRYWARSYVGWQHMDRADPNPGHRILAEWNAEGIISGIVTQNVDGLHQLAARRVGDGSDAPLISLHGDMEQVECLSCGATEDREHLDIRFRDANPTFLDELQAALDDRAGSPQQINPDGDADLPEEFVGKFTMVGCLVCGSEQLKPTVVYFGESVPPERKARVDELLDDSGAVLVVGSSLAVMSGFKIVLDARREKKPVGVINGGPSRADDRATFRWRTRVTGALEWLDEESQRPRI